MVKLRTSVINSLQGIINRNYGVKLAAGKIKQVSQDHVTPLLAGEDDLALSGTVSKDTIDYLSQQITKVERSVKNKVTTKPAFTCLQTIPGVGLILALTITLETGSIGRFAKVGNFTSYCRKVPTSWTSNNKNKGKGNKKNGNKYLAWAFSEAAEFARRYNEMARVFYNRKMARTNRMVAHTALAHKLARASYYIMRDNVEFDNNKLFA